MMVKEKRGTMKTTEDMAGVTMMASYGGGIRIYRGRGEIERWTTSLVKMR